MKRRVGWRGCRDPDVVSWRDAEKEDRETE
jgi:hypothetical protein